MKPVVNTLIIGAAKAGTSTLATRLRQHSQCCVSRPKETMFFGSPKRFKNGYDWYHNEYFSHYNDEAIVCDATPAYSNRDRHPGTASRAHQYNPNFKIIYMLRHPIQRIESAWKMYASSHTGHADPVLDRNVEFALQGFEFFLSDDSIYNDLLATCRYEYQLEEWRKHFPEKSIHVMFLEDLKSAEHSEMNKLADFLAIDVNDLLNADQTVVNSAASRHEITTARTMLAKTGLSKLGRKVLPKTMVNYLVTSPLGSRPLNQRNADWTVPLRNKIRSDLQSETIKLLEKYGKPPEFYQF